MFAHVVSALTVAHRDRLVLASIAQWPEIQPLVSRGQIVSPDIQLRTDGHTTITIFSIMTAYIIIAIDDKLCLENITVTLARLM